MSGSPSLFSLHTFLSLYLPATLLSLGNSMVAPVIPVFARSFEVSFTSASLVFVAAQLGHLAVTFPAGVLMDKIGRRPVLLAGPVLTAVGSFATPFSPSFEWMVVCRFIVGAGAQLWQESRMVVIADTVGHRQRARQIQWMMGVSRAGHLFGPALGGLLAAGIGIWIPFVLHGILTLLAIIPSFKLIGESAPERRGRGEPSHESLPSSEAKGAAGAEDPGWRGIIALFFTFQIVIFLGAQLFAQFARGGHEHGSLNLYAVYKFDLGPDMLGLMATAAVIFGIPVPFITGWAMDKYGRKSVIVPGFASYGVTALLMSLTAFLELPFAVFIVLYVMVQATMGTTGGTMQVLGTDLSPALGRGRFFAIWRTISAVGGTVSPAVFAIISDQAGFGAGFVFLGLCALSVAVLVGFVLGDTAKYAEAREREQDRQRTATPA